MEHHWMSPFQNICWFYFAFSLPAKTSKKSLLCALVTLNTDRLYILFMGIRLLVQRAIHRLGCIPLETRGRWKLCACVGNYNWNAFVLPSDTHPSCPVTASPVPRGWSSICWFFTAGCYGWPCAIIWLGVNEIYSSDYIIQSDPHIIDPAGWEIDWGKIKKANWSLRTPPQFVFNIGGRRPLSEGWNGWKTFNISEYWMLMCDLFPNVFQRLPQPSPPPRGGTR